MEEELNSQPQTNLQNLNTLNLKISGGTSLKPTIYVDGKILKYKKDNFGNLTTTYTTEKSSVLVEIKKLYDINGTLWFLTSLFFFIISIFGIFDLKPDKRCISIVASIKVNITNNSSLKIRFKPRNQTEKAFELEPTDCEVAEETNNNYFIDTVAKKRYKVMRIVKIFLWLLLIGLIVYLIYLKVSTL